MKAQLLLLLAMFLSWIGSIGLLGNLSFLPVDQIDLHQPVIYAYKDWQSAGIVVHSGDQIEVAAKGTWFYTPREFHGPNGHPIYQAPDFYPVPYAAGGALIGRIGEEGNPFMVGEHTEIGDYNFASENSSNGSGADATNYGGVLYFRINDDILSDNDGVMTVRVVVKKAAQQN